MNSPAVVGRLERGVSALVPKLAKRGYAAVGLHMPKTPANVGSVLRAAHCYGVAMVAQTGRRYHSASTDTMKAYRYLPLLNVNGAMLLWQQEPKPLPGYGEQKEKA
jgi:tRNA G18 (ribose-2'-O)-methylase SpoU